MSAAQSGGTEHAEALRLAERITRTGEFGMVDPIKVSRALIETHAALRNVVLTPAGYESKLAWERAIDLIGTE